MYRQCLATASLTASCITQFIPSGHYCVSRQFNTIEQCSDTLNKMEKTINNIKKILHIGSRKLKDEQDFDDEKHKVQEKVLTANVELTRFEIPREFDLSKDNQLTFAHSLIEQIFIVIHSPRLDNNPYT